MPLLASELFRSAGDELNDLQPGDEHVRWTVPDLAGYLTDAIAQLAALKPTLFYSFVPLRLGPGAVQSVPGEYSNLLDVLYNLDRDGLQTERIVLGNFSAARAFNRPACGSDPYIVRTVSLHPESKRYYYVDPPVPNVQPYPAVWALVQFAPMVVTGPTDGIVMPNTTAETYRAPLLNWMLYRAFGRDTESSESFNKSEAYYKSFYQFLGVPPRDLDAVPVAKGVTSAATA